MVQPFFKLYYSKQKLIVFQLIQNVPITLLHIITPVRVFLFIPVKKEKTACLSPVSKRRTILVNKQQKDQREQPALLTAHFPDSPLFQHPLNEIPVPSKAHFNV